jgi:hypothetical protein
LTNTKVKPSIKQFLDKLWFYREVFGLTVVEFSKCQNYYYATFSGFLNRFSPLKKLQKRVEIFLKLLQMSLRKGQWQLVKNDKNVDQSIISFKQEMKERIFSSVCGTNRIFNAINRFSLPWRMNTFYRIKLTLPKQEFISRENVSLLNQSKISHGIQDNLEWKRTMKSLPSSIFKAIELNFLSRQYGIAIAICANFQTPNFKGSA